MPQNLKAARKLFVMNAIVLFSWGGICFVILWIGIAYDDANAENARIEKSVEEMRIKLGAAKLSGDQINVLLQVHESALYRDVVLSQIIMKYVWVCIWLLMGTFGFSQICIRCQNHSLPSRDSVKGFE